MDDLRSEIRAAFEKEQATHPPIGGLRSQLTAAAAIQTRPSRSLQWIAVAVAAILGILVVAGLLSTRLGPRANVPLPAMEDYGTPPPGVQLLYVHDPQHPSWLIGYDWSGKPRGTVKLAPSSASDPAGVKMAPDGSGFELGGTYKASTGVFLDRLGRQIPAAATPYTGFAGALWADDSKHQCLISLDQKTFVWGLSTLLPGEPTRHVAVIARDPGIGQSGISLVACSFQNDLAIALRTTIAWPAELWVVRLSDGTILAHHTYSASARLATVAASGDGKYIAESSAKGRGFDSPDTSQGAASTVIRRVSDWQVVKNLDPTVQVFRFSGDDSLLLVSASQQTSQMANLSVLNWSAGSTVWQAKTTDPFAIAILVQPAGLDFALASVTLGIQPLTATIWIVHGDGSTTNFTQSLQPAW